MASTCKAQSCRICRPVLCRASSPSSTPKHAQLLSSSVRAFRTSRVRVRMAPTAARALPALPSLPSLVIRPSGFIIEAVFAAAALAVGGIAASVFGLVFSSLFSVFAVAAAVGGVIWISTVAITGAVAIGVGAVAVTFAVAAFGGKNILGAGKQGEDAIREAEAKVRDIGSEYSKGEFVWKDGVGSFQKGARAAPQKGKVVDIQLDPEEEEMVRKNRQMKEEAREMDDELSDFDRRLRGQK